MATDRRILMDCKKGPECSLFNNDKGHAFYQPPFHFTVHTCHDNINNSVNKAVNSVVQKKIGYLFVHSFFETVSIAFIQN